MNTARFCKLLLLIPRALAAYESKPTKTNFDRWYSLSSEYSRLLRERQDAQAGAR